MCRRQQHKANQTVKNGIYSPSIMWMQLDQSIASNVVAYIQHRSITWYSSYWSSGHSSGLLYTCDNIFGGASKVLEPYGCIYTPQGV